MHTPVPWSADFDRLLRGQLPFLPPQAAVAVDSVLLDLGLDSLGAVAVVTGLEELYDLELDEQLADPDLFSTAGYLWAVVERVRADVA